MVVLGKKNTHKKLVDIVNDRLSNATNRYGMSFYDFVNKEQEFYRPGCPDCVMEVDNYALKYGKNGTLYVLLFEDKSSNKRKHKAMYQLDREHKNIDLILKKHNLANPDKLRVFEFYVHDHKNPKVEWLKSNIRDYYSMKEELKHIYWAKQNFDSELFIQVSLSFQTDFLDRVSKMKPEHARDILDMYNSVYSGGKQ